MLDAAKEVEQFASGKSREDLDRDRLLTLGVIKAIEMIGEAASKVTSDARGQFPDIPWEDIIGMRNRLIHGYYKVDLNRVWTTIIDDIPRLRKQLEEIVTEYWMD
jgi:uncharacterized protein with HEPN domain